jgi:alkyldihydroxyacetonephosphate synthase
MSPSSSEKGITRLRRLWGWGYEDESYPQSWTDRILPFLRGIFPQAIPFPPPPGLSDYNLPPPRFSPPRGEGFPEVSSSPYDRVLHAMGRSLHDLIRLRLGRVESFPDYVAYPQREEEILRIMEWAERERISLVPFGGGSSVTGGVEAVLPEGMEGVITVDLSRMNRILSVDEVSRMAEVEAGIYGPELDDLLKERGLTFRHFPQSYLFSTLGGWIATRSAGHYATSEGKIESRVRGLTVITPSRGRLSFPPFPGSSMGPDPMRVWIGSEGILGIISRAVIELKPIPAYREVIGVRIPDFLSALEAVRAVIQAGFSLSHLRALDPWETFVYRMMRGENRPPEEAFLIVGDESPSEPVRASLESVFRILRRYGGVMVGKEEDRGDPSNWRSFFFAQPYLRDLLVGEGYLVDTLETAVTFGKAYELYESVREEILKVLEARCGGGFVSCRTTHVYPTGISLYFSFLAPSDPEGMGEVLKDIKSRALSRIVEMGGTASHHHACGRDHKEWLVRELPRGWVEFLREMKGSLDPAGIMNPGVLL